MGWYFRTFSAGSSAVSIEDMNDVQVVLQELRERGWTLVGIAEELGVFRTAVDKWVAGLRYPRNAKAVLALLATLRRRRTRPLRPLAAAAPEAEPSLAEPVMPPRPELRGQFAELQQLLDNDWARLETPEWADEGLKQTA